MPIAWVKHPEDKTQLVPIDEVLAGALDEWYPRAYVLAAVGEERVYDGGKPHVTGLLNGPLYEILKATKNYAEDLDGMVWAVLGKSAHKVFERGGELTEVELANDYMCGRADGIVYNERLGGMGIEDHKYWGAFKIARTLGAYSDSKWEPVVENGEVVYYKSGQKKGQRRMKKVTVRGVDPERADIFDLRAQLNGYRLLWEDQPECSELNRIAWMRVCMYARDGNTWKAREWGIEKNVYVRSIPHWDGATDWFMSRSHELQSLWSSGSQPRLCDERESWQGRRCSGYCPVAQFCPKGREAAPTASEEGSE